MAIIEDALSNLNDIKTQIPFWIKDVILENAEKIKDILRNNQLNKGLDSSGSIVGTYWWTTEYIYAKNPDNRPRQPKEKGQPYNFEWSGELFDTMKVVVSPQDNDFDIYSSTGKDKFVEKKMNANLMDLTKENNDFINEKIIEPYIAKKIEERLFDF